VVQAIFYAPPLFGDINDAFSRHNRMIKMKQKTMFDPQFGTPQKPSGPVTCLGRTFESEDARRAHYTEELRKTLQDPEFRKIEGFPIGSDEDILNLSDPPYYTACPALSRLYLFSFFPFSNNPGSRDMRRLFHVLPL
jgi:hypothetical protein